ncbi:hypothetical protein DTO280E4_8571 [Paecilomyces variotii]|nr:hypothetical protein DTO169E5_7286 [Paecilomyces variotii]KAJ9250300.1 hypothetical protein DTO195F2_8175 [Paecilomyces variotii]KAJ9257481.1 hypothetical protein DTO212C5_8884 [Paecilomyces variotii]KAJ9350699.1 hypothetical protein DTO280E4_8571 [Paecilomyces variotii]KAJ9369758.1 hypothetical protein DTO282E5_5580 [Paecilomyces variotii]
MCTASSETVHHGDSQRGAWAIWKTTACEDLDHGSKDSEKAEAAGHSFTAPSPSFDKLTRNIFSSPFLELLVLPVTVLGLSDT